MPDMTRRSSKIAVQNFHEIHKQNDKSHVITLHILGIALKGQKHINNLTNALKYQISENQHKYSGGNYSTIFL